MERGGKGQLPGVQSAKVRPGYRVQSLHRGQAAVPSNQNEIITKLRRHACPVVDSVRDVR